MIGAKEFAKKFKPKVRGKSDKYSWRLYQRIRTNGRERVYLMAHDIIQGVYEPNIDDLKSEVLRSSRIAVGRIYECGDFVGKRLSNIFSPSDKYSNYCYGGNEFATNKWIDITDWFWHRYEHYGRCAFVGDYSHEWQEINRNSRKCKHCGKHERRTVETRRKIERVEVWQ